MAAIIRRGAVCLLFTAAAFAAFAASTVAQAQTPPPPAPFLAVSPANVTMSVGESRSFRLVDQNGRMQYDTEWSISIPEDFIVQQSDEVWITAKDHGHYTLRGVSSAGAAEAIVTVVDGPLKFGDVIWSEARIPGCQGKQIVQAVPTSNGPALYEISQCPDGTYVAAFTADGMQMWRRKIGSSALPQMPAGTPVSADTPMPRLNTHPVSVCESVMVGTEQQKVRDILDASHLSFNEGSPGAREWVVEERGSQCNIWFDPQLRVSKKRKTLVEQ